MPWVRALNLYHRREREALERLRQGNGELRISHVRIAGLSQPPPQIMSIPEAIHVQVLVCLPDKKHLLQRNKQPIILNLQLYDISKSMHRQPEIL